MWIDPPMRPIPLRTVALNISGIALAYSGCRQKGHMYGQSVKSSSAGTTDALGLYCFKDLLQCLTDFENHTLRLLTAFGVPVHT